jgi:hypothetical protein
LLIVLIHLAEAVDAATSRLPEYIALFAPIGYCDGLV